MILLLLQVSFGMAAPHVSASPRAQHDRAPRISEVNLLTPLVPRYEKFEAAFQIDTSATNLNLPYDAKPPPGILPDEGISVDVLFSPDNWHTTIVQPAFWYQPVLVQTRDKQNYLLPQGEPGWRVRFAPQRAGAWQFRIRAQDKNGTTVTPAHEAFSFHVTEGSGRYDGLRQNPSTRHGFLRVSKNDSRYFEFQDGTPFHGLGYNLDTKRIHDVAARLRAWEQNGLNFARVWMSNDGINGQQERPWLASQEAEGRGNPNALLDSQTVFGNAQLSYRLDNALPCMFGYFGPNSIAVEPNTAYSITIHAKLTDVEPRSNASDAGLTVLESFWPSKGCASVKGKPLIAPRVGTTDWYTATGSLTTRDGQHFIRYLYLMLKDVAAGSANIDSIALTRRDDPAQINLLRRGRADSHLHFDSVAAAKWDFIVDHAAQHGVYLKLVVDEKNDWIRNTLQADGTFGKRDNNNFYAAPDTAVRWLQEAWWRYIIARWGYSTAIHSFEYVNEGDPYNGNHYKAAAAMAEYFDAHDPAQHMVSTSMWHSFPAAAFWANPKYQALDYADLHAYLTTNIDSDEGAFPPALLETRRDFVHSGARSLRVPANQALNVSVTPRGLALNEPGEWTIRYWAKAENFQSHCENGSKGGMLRVRWMLDDGSSQGGSEGIVPARADGKNFLCNSADGTFDWTQFRSTHDRDGNELASEQRLVIRDAKTHELRLYVQNTANGDGEAWIDDIEIISPSGARVSVLGTFEDRNFTQDTAWYTAAYSLLRGATSPVSARKPLVRGEAGMNSVEYPNGLLTMNQDREGIWLHNFVWGQINPGGMYDLLWWGNSMIQDNPQKGRHGDLYAVFTPFAKFMQDIPLNNGHYRDAHAITSNPRVRVWGQRDDVNGRAHLWIQNLDHQWETVVAGEPIAPQSGTITLRDLPAGLYQIEWWDTYRAENQITRSQTLRVTDTLNLTLPRAFTSDIAVKIKRIAE